MRRLLAAVLLLGACAAAPPRPGGTREEAREAEVLYEKLRSLDAEMTTVGATASECAQVETLHTNICALAARICQIAEQQPATSPVRLRCDDSKERCRRAGERARSHGCAGPPK